MTVEQVAKRLCILFEYFNYNQLEYDYEPDDHHHKPRHGEKVASINDEYALIYYTDMDNCTRVTVPNVDAYIWDLPANQLFDLKNSKISFSDFDRAKKFILAHPEFPKSVYVDNSTNRIFYSAITDIGGYTFLSDITIMKQVKHSYYTYQMEYER